MRYAKDDARDFRCDAWRVLATTLSQHLNSEGATIVLVTHDADIADYCSRIVVFKDGAIVSDHRNQRIRSAALALSQGSIDTDEEEAA